LIQGALISAEQLSKLNSKDISRLDIGIQA
jgi:hypothetical protein